MPKNTRKNSSYNYMYLAAALICVIVASIITSLIAFGNFGDADESVESSIPQESSEAVSVPIEISMPDTSDSSIAGSISFDSLTINNSAVGKGYLSIISSSDAVFRTSEDLDLIRVYGNKQGTYGLSGTGVMIDKTALTMFDSLLISFENTLTKNGVIIDSGYTSKETLVTKKQLEDYADLTSGSSVRFSLSGSKYSFDSTEFSYLYEQAYKYGIIQRYPANKNQVTGKNENKVLFRYIGLAHSQYMHIYNLTLEEYIDLLKNNEGYLEIESTLEENTTYLVKYTKMSAGGSTQVEVPADGTKYPYDISGDGSGGYIVTIKVAS